MIGMKVGLTFDNFRDKFAEDGVNATCLDKFGTSLNILSSCLANMLAKTRLMIGHTIYYKPFKQPSTALTMPALGYPSGLYT
jgi:hypothetical protein